MQRALNISPPIIDFQYIYIRTAYQIFEQKGAVDERYFFLHWSIELYIEAAHKNSLHEANLIDATMYNVTEKKERICQIYIKFCLFSEDMVIMTAKIILRQNVIFNYPRNFDIADIKCFTVSLTTLLLY